MKNKIFMLICAAFICGSVSAQKITMDKVPASVSSTFKSKFPSVAHANWMMAGSNYQADFTANNMQEKATFGPAGNWLKTDTSIKSSEIPAVVKESITKQFTGYAIGTASKMENADHANGYEVELSKGKDIVDVTLSAKGAVMSQEPRQASAVKTN